MKSLTKYRIVIEDESHLTEKFSYRFSAPGFWARMLVVFFVMLVLAGLLIYVTPLRMLMPGYLKESQRSATEEGLLRLDSLMSAYEVNQQFIDNFLRVSDTNRAHGDSASVKQESRELSVDSLMTPSKEEKRFMTQMEERERFNISVLTPLAADGISFTPPTLHGVFTHASRDSEESVVILPAEESVLSVAEGAVVAAYYSPADRGYVVIVQHNRGFVSVYRHTGTPLAGIGDNVSAGQPVALSPGADKTGRRQFFVRMWHNGLSIIPYEYIAQPDVKRNQQGANYEDPRGTL